jgi:hypothetical protein
MLAVGDWALTEAIAAFPIAEVTASHVYSCVMAARKRTVSKPIPV